MQIFISKTLNEIGCSSIIGCVTVTFVILAVLRCIETNITWLIRVVMKILIYTQVKIVRKDVALGAGDYCVNCTRVHNNTVSKNGHRSNNNVKIKYKSYEINFQIYCKLAAVVLQLMFIMNSGFILLEALHTYSVITNVISQGKMFGYKTVYLLCISNVLVTFYK